jgi:hypothetical protein
VCLLLLVFAFFAPLLFAGLTFSLHLFAILGIANARIKSTMTPCQSEDNVDLEVADASTHDDTAEARSTFDQEAC